jgi:hypothetical protein
VLLDIFENGSLILMQKLDEQTKRMAYLLKTVIKWFENKSSEKEQYDKYVIKRRKTKL